MRIYHRSGKSPVLSNLFLAQIDNTSFVNYDVNTSSLSLKGSDSQYGSATLCILRKPIPLIPISDGELVSTCMASLACVRGRSTVAVGHLNCSLKFPAQCSWEWINEPSNVLITHLTLDFRGPVFLISRYRLPLLLIVTALSVFLNFLIHHWSFSFLMLLVSWLLGGLLF